MTPAIRLSEKAFESQVKELAAACGWKYYHTWRSDRSPAGFPDCVMVRAFDKRTVYAELKAEDGKVSKEQQEWLDTLAAAGNEVYIWRPSEIQDIYEVLR